MLLKLFANCEEPLDDEEEEPLDDEEEDPLEESEVDKVYVFV